MRGPDGSTTCSWSKTLNSSAFCAVGSYVSNISFRSSVPVLHSIFEQETSDRAFEEEVMLVGFGQANVKAEGSAVGFDTASESFTARYTHDTIALAFALTEEAVEDNLYDTLSARYTKALNVAIARRDKIRKGKGPNVTITRIVHAPVLYPHCTH